MPEGNEIMKRVVLLAGIAAIASPAFAQTASLPASFGTTTLQGGFSPDPQSVQIVAGGAIDASQGETGAAGCFGMIADAPDYRLNFTPGDLPLNIFAESAGDVSLVVNLPDGSWACDDDTHGFNPALTFENPMPGQYDIWVGLLGGDGATVLSFSEITTSTTIETADVDPVGGGLDLSADPTFGTMNLSAGFTPDPQIVELIAGGETDMATVAPGCVGWAASAPDVRLNYEAGDYPLAFLATSEADIALAINLPDGSWVCDDDSGGDFDPLVVLSSPASGQYDIFVTTVSEVPETLPAALAVTEAIPAN